ncbi:TPA: zf-HC2 domain-containing protein [Candidatus Poribacteria bacterium]|nr:zf-HC2 domain-containing protein [Candidatus Poribacteria bacterium]HEX30961.1 zf-HC2 domain-containing protein [Candidatus Poribacteria bacterium]
MKCAQAQKALFSFLSGDRDLDRKTQDELLEHLNHCPRCQEKWQQLQITHQALESLAREEDVPKAPADFWDRLKYKLEPPASTRPDILAKLGELMGFMRRIIWVSKFRRAVALSILVFSLGLIGYGIFHNHDRSPEVYPSENLTGNRYPIEEILYIPEPSDRRVL